MTNSALIYDYEEFDRQPEGTRYYFISNGERQIVKAVVYEYIGLKENRLTYNLGFGTYNHENGEVEDYDISANGDHYKVFNTVLSTIPHFLHNYPGAMVMVEGSDSSNAYPDICRSKCKKKCIPPACKNAHRRITIYKNFINKNFNLLSQEYNFFGGIKKHGYQAIAEEYKIPNNYESVFFIKKIM